MAGICVNNVNKKGREFHGLSLKSRGFGYLTVSTTVESNVVAQQESTCTAQLSVAGVVFSSAEGAEQEAIVRIKADIKSNFFIIWF